jgi:Bacterial type II and III secretion system protein
MIRRSTLALFLVLLAGCLESVAAQSGKQVRVTFEFRQVGTQQRDAVDAGGRVIITERGDARGAGRVGATSTERRVQTSTSIFTLVQDGGESTLLVASQVPYSQVAFYRDYLTGAGLVGAGVQFRDVGTSLKVGAAVLPGNQVKVRLTPSISWFSADKAGVIDVTEASTELVVPNGRPIVLGGATTQTHDLTRRILGYRATSSASETLMALTATVR